MYVTIRVLVQLTHLSLQYSSRHIYGTSRAIPIPVFAFEDGAASKVRAKLFILACELGLYQTLSFTWWYKTVFSLLSHFVFGPIRTVPGASSAI